jgi:hypothetical protein
MNENNNIKETEENSITAIEEDFDDDWGGVDGLLTKSQYDVPDSADTFIDTKNGKVINKKDLTPFQMIKSIAKQNGNQIKDPNKSCTHCYGRGYDGLDSETNMPIPCRCLFRGKSETEKSDELMYDSKNMQRKTNRDQRRRMSKALFKQFKIERSLMRERMGDIKKSDDFRKEPIERNEEEIHQEIAIVVAKYAELNSFQKTAHVLNMTKTKVEKIIKGSETSKEVHKI